MNFGQTLGVDHPLYPLTESSSDTTKPQNDATKLIQVEKKKKKKKPLNTSAEYRLSPESLSVILPEPPSNNDTVNNNTPTPNIGKTYTETNGVNGVLKEGFATVRVEELSELKHWAKKIHQENQTLLLERDKAFRLYKTEHELRASIDESHQKLLKESEKLFNRSGGSGSAFEHVEKENLDLKRQVEVYASEIDALRSETSELFLLLKDTERKHKELQIRTKALAESGHQNTLDKNFLSEKCDKLQHRIVELESHYESVRGELAQCELQMKMYESVKALWEEEARKKKEEQEKGVVDKKSQEMGAKYYEEYIAMLNGVIKEYAEAYGACCREDDQRINDFEAFLNNHYQILFQLEKEFSQLEEYLEGWQKEFVLQETSNEDALAKCRYECQVKLESLMNRVKQSRQEEKSEWKRRYSTIYQDVLEKNFLARPNPQKQKKKTVVKRPNYSQNLFYIKYWLQPQPVVKINLRSKHHDFRKRWMIYRPSENSLHIHHDVDSAIADDSSKAKVIPLNNIQKVSFALHSNVYHWWKGSCSSLGPGFLIPLDTAKETFCHAHFVKGKDFNPKDRASYNVCDAHYHGDHCGDDYSTPLERVKYAPANPVFRVLKGVSADAASITSIPNLPIYQAVTIMTRERSYDIILNDEFAVKSLLILMSTLSSSPYEGVRVQTNSQYSNAKTQMKILNYAQTQKCSVYTLYKRAIIKTIEDRLRKQGHQPPSPVPSSSSSSSNSLLESSSSLSVPSSSDSSSLLNTNAAIAPRSTGKIIPVRQNVVLSDQVVHNTPVNRLVTQQQGISGGIKTALNERKEQMVDEPPLPRRSRHLSVEDIEERKSTPLFTSYP